MDPLEPEIEALALVCVGTFHPGLLQPSWLARQGLLPEGEADAAVIGVISNDVTQFSTEWFTLECIAQRLQVSTQLRHYYFPLGDLMAGILRVSPATAVVALGINHEGHFGVGSEKRWHALGHDIVPKTFWNSLLKSAGTTSVSVEGQRPDDLPGRILLKLEPSQRYAASVFLSSNDHFNIDPQVEDSAGAVAELINDNLAASLERSDRYFKEVVRHSQEIEVK